MKASYTKRILKFIKPAGTSRGVLLEKPSWYLCLSGEKTPEKKAIGEISIIPGLSIDNPALIEDKIQEICISISSGKEIDYDELRNFPAIKFGLEMAITNYVNGCNNILWATDFTLGKRGIVTNGLIWMGQVEAMQKQVEKKLADGFKCIKMKIGSINIADELDILTKLRERFPSSDLEIRVDANGAFHPDNVIEILKRLHELEIHSIEQPIRQGQVEEMAKLCELSPVDIALDEELIGLYTQTQKQELVNSIKPKYLILKPSLLGGVEECKEWINAAESTNIKWWATSALESNVGLNAIAQWISLYDTGMVQGLGLGNLYKENVTSPLRLKGEKLFYDPSSEWNFEFVY